MPVYSLNLATRYNSTKKYVPLSKFFLDMEKEDECIDDLVDNSEQGDSVDVDGNEIEEPEEEIEEPEKSDKNPYLKHQFKIPEKDKKDKENKKKDEKKKKDKKDTSAKENDKEEKQEMTTTANVAVVPIPLGAGDGRKFLDFMDKKKKKKKEKKGRFPLLMRYFS